MRSSALNKLERERRDRERWKDIASTLRKQEEPYRRYIDLTMLILKREREQESE